MKKGFTLAEVLITLVIIGVIAALTIPNLMQKYRKHQIEVSVKTAYSILNNALNMAAAEHGSLMELFEDARLKEANPDNSTARSSDYFTDNYLKPYLKFGKSCPSKTRDCDGIFVTHKNAPYQLADINGDPMNKSATIPSNWSRLLLDNGMYLGVFYHVKDENNSGYSFIFDVNGGKGPNRIAHDIFYFNIGTFRPGNLLAGPWTSWGSEADYNRYAIKGDYCKSTNVYTNVYVGGQLCSGRLVGNGWKFPDDYPVKKW